MQGVGGREGEVGGGRLRPSQVKHLGLENTSHAFCHISNTVGQDFSVGLVYEAEHSQSNLSTDSPVI